MEQCQRPASQPRWPWTWGPDLTTSGRRGPACGNDLRLRLACPPTRDSPGFTQLAILAPPHPALPIKVRAKSVALPSLHLLVGVDTPACSPHEPPGCLQSPPPPAPPSSRLGDAASSPYPPSGLRTPPPTPRNTWPPLAPRTGALRPVRTEQKQKGSPLPNTLEGS